MATESGCVETVRNGEQIVLLQLDDAGKCAGLLAVIPEIDYGVRQEKFLSDPEAGPGVMFGDEDYSVLGAGELKAYGAYLLARVLDPEALKDLTPVTAYENMRNLPTAA